MCVKHRLNECLNVFLKTALYDTSEQEIWHTAATKNHQWRVHFFSHAGALAEIAKRKLPLMPVGVAVDRPLPRAGPNLSLPLGIEPHVG